MPTPGTRVGPWLVEREIGRGTTATVFAATRDGDPTESALKLPLPGTLRDRAAVDRFLRGATAQQELSHPGVLAVTDLGTDPAHGPYVVSPLIDGPTLSAAIAQGTLPATTALGVLEAVAGGLDAAADARLVHRDVKPSNILLGAGGAVLADFGLARDHEDDPTTTGALAGTLAYLAPELVRGGRPSPASDRYALACVAFQALTGRSVFPRATDAAVLYAHVDEAPPRASELRPELPQAVDAVLASGLAKAPEDRPASASAFVDALRAALGKAAATLGSPAPLPSARADETLVPATPLPAAPAPAPSDAALARRSWRLPAIAGLVAVALIAAGIGLFAGHRASGGDADVPPVGKGLLALGSPLTGDSQVASRDCDGRVPSGTSPTCSISQLALPGRTLTVPQDGLIRAFAVRGARGPVALQVLRTKDGRTFQVSRSDTFDVRSGAPRRFGVELDAEAGDRIALAMEPRTQIGMRETAGARTERWSTQVSGDSPQGNTRGLDRELLLRAELDPGAVRTPPRQLTGAAAAAAAAGREVAASSAKLPDGREVRVALVEVGGRVVIDLERGGKRRARLWLEGVTAGGSPVEFKAFTVPKNDSQLNVGWRNPGQTSAVERYFGLGPGSLEAYS